MKEKKKVTIFKRSPLLISMVLVLFALCIIGVWAEASLEGGSEDATVTLDEYKQINIGTTYEDVASFIGEGTVVSDSGNTTIYEFKGNGKTGANARFIFKDGKLIIKSQFGLK